MKWLRVLLLLAALGLAAALWAVIDAQRTPPAPPPPATPRPPFAEYVAGTGITETGRGNVAVGSPTEGVVRTIDVRVGQVVSAGDPLFRLDDRDLLARYQVALAEARQAEAAVAGPRHRLDYLLALQGLDKAAISRETVSNARDDLRAAQASADAAQARARQLQVDLGRLVVRAPQAGRILQVNARSGEFVSGSAARPPILLGDDARMFVRVDIDENDAWRVRPGAEARAFVRGNPRLAIPLRFEYVEPYVVPKTSLTGQATERTDVRVLQVVYSFPRDGLPVYLGEQLDVYLRAAPEPSRAAPGQ